MGERVATAGTLFAEALAEKDFERIGELLHPEVDFRGLTPRKFWEAHGSQAVIRDILPEWFEESDDIEALEKLETDVIVDKERVGYRFRLRCPDGVFLLEQQVYLTTADGRINWMRALCSGARPIDVQGCGKGSLAT